MSPLFAALRSPGKGKNAAKSPGLSVDQSESDSSPIPESSSALRPSTGTSAAGGSRQSLFKKRASTILPSTTQEAESSGRSTTAGSSNRKVPPSPLVLPHSNDKPRQQQYAFPSSRDPMPASVPPPMTSPIRIRSHSAMALAHASLGLGLAPGLQPAPAASSFGKFSLSRQLRRTKSFIPNERDRQSADVPERAKVTSITATPPPPPPEPRPSKDTTLPNRRASFWLRKRVDSTKSARKVPVEPVPPAPIPTPIIQYLDATLPPVRSFTPLGFENRVPSPTSTISTARSMVRDQSTKSPRSSISSFLGFGGNGGHSLGVQEINISESPVQSPTRSRSFTIMSPPVPPSPNIQPATPITSQASRPRSRTNPPLLRRISSSFFQLTSNNATRPSTPVLSDSPPNTASSSQDPPATSKRVMPKPRIDEGETSEDFVARLIEAVSKAEVANVLASSIDPFYIRSLQLYIDRFDFTLDPLDVALRKLLMDLGLPRETQQIDRVMEAFAARYLACNPGLFASDDHPYILAFSLMMLHTDAFNRSNKHKMTKADYVKNTRLPGVPPEVLDYFFDNIVFAPFIFIEDPADAHSGPAPNGLGMLHAAAGSTTSVLKTNRIDPYYMITQNLLGPLRLDVSAHIPLSDPISYLGTAADPWDVESLREIFANAQSLVISSPDAMFTPRWRQSVTLESLSMAGVQPGMMPFRSSMDQGSSSIPEPAGTMTIRIVKQGVVSRKEDLLEGGRRASNRKWRAWSMALTGSQLLFFRDLNWHGGEGEQPLPSALPSSGSSRIVQTPTDLRPDEVVSLDDSIALFDRSYTKYPNTLRFLLPLGRQFLIQASSESELNEWISCINYGSTFKTAGIRMRPMAMSAREAEMTGVAAASSHIRDQDRMQREFMSPVLKSWIRRSHEGASREEDDVPSSSDVPSSASSSAEPSSVGYPSPFAPQSISSSTSVHNGAQTNGVPPKAARAVDMESSTLRREETVDQVKATFDEVKAELAFGLVVNSKQGVSLRRSATLPAGSMMASSPTSLTSTEKGAGPRYSARMDLIRSKVRDLDAKITTTQLRLDTDLRFAHNLAVLTPFQQATRQRIETAVAQAAKRIQQVRMDMAKLMCYREVLRNDISAEEKQWIETKQEALRAATATLKTSQTSPSTESHPQPQPQPQPRSPTQTHNHLQPVKPLVIDIVPRPSSSGVSELQSPESARTQSAMSFFSAREEPMSADSDRTEMFSPSSFRTALRSALSPPIIEAESPLETYPFPINYDILSTTSNTPSPRESHTGHSFSSHQTGSEAPERLPVLAGSAGLGDEQAEEWDKTRAGKRVSLVMVPVEVARFSATLRPVRSEGEISSAASSHRGRPTSYSRSPSPGRPAVSQAEGEVTSS